jgi:hypothetical protein
MKRAKQTKGGARKRPCPVLALAIEADGIIAAMNAVEANEKMGIEHHVYDVLLDRLDAIKTAASYATATTAAGASFQAMVIGGEADGLVSSTYENEAEQRALERRVHRLIERVVMYLQSLDGPALKHVQDYFHSDWSHTDNKLAEALAMGKAA